MILVARIEWIYCESCKNYDIAKGCLLNPNGRDIEQYLEIYNNNVYCSAGENKYETTNCGD